MFKLFGHDIRHIFFRLFSLESLMKGTNDSHTFLEGLQSGFRLDPQTVSVNRIPVSEVCAAPERHWESGLLIDEEDWP